MVKKLLDSKLFYAILSVIIAVSLWYYVTNAEGVTDTDTVSSIPIVVEGDDLLLAKGLMITSDIPRVSMRFEATAANLYKLKQEGAVSATLNVSSITQPGTYTMAYEVSYNGISRGNFTVVDQSPVNVTFVVESYISREFPIHGKFTGRLAEGYMLALEDNQPRFEFLPNVITVSGLESDVNKISYAQVTINDVELSKTVRREASYQLIGWDGQPLDREKMEIKCSHETVTTTLEVQMYAEIDLVVDFLDGGGASLKENVTWEIYPRSIAVAGEKEALESLAARGKLSVATINLAEIPSGETTLIKTIPLSAELTNLEGVTEATITITVTGLVSKTMEVTEFDIQNVPEGYEATVLTKSLFVTVRGTLEELEGASAANLRVVADLSNINLSAGQYTINARIYFDSVGDAGVIGTYPLVVRLSTPEPNETR